ncbi:MAG: hypothetical protein ACK4ND_07515 [Cytophagaceae bacterium]
MKKTQIRNSAYRKHPCLPQAGAHIHSRNEASASAPDIKPTS